jgi:hypothetical protein
MALEPKGCTLHIHRHESLKSNKNFVFNRGDDVEGERKSEKITAELPRG